MSVLAFLVVAAIAGAGPSTSYSKLLRSYLEGDVEGSIREAATLSRKEIRALERELTSGPPPLATEDTKAAILLHTQAGIINEGRGERKLRDAHLDLALALAESLEPGDFHRDWLRALGYYYESTLEERKAVDCFERLTERYPKSAAGWLGWATVLETVASVGNPSSPQLGLLASSPWHGEEREVVSGRRFTLRRSLRLSKLGRARELYEEALARAPNEPEIHLRLGRVSELLGEEHAAREHYAWVIQSGAEGFDRAMARLFLGRMLERGGALDAAIAQYRDAMLDEPSLQMTYLALSHALQVSGERHTAKAILTRALRLGELEPSPRRGRGRYLFRLDAFLDGVLSLQSELVR